MGCNAFAEGDEDVLTRIEELIIRPVADVHKAKATKQPDGNNDPQSEPIIHMVTRSQSKARTDQEVTAPHQRSGLLAVATEAAAQKLIPLLEMGATGCIPRTAVQTADTSKPQNQDVCCDTRREEDRVTTDK